MDVKDKAKQVIIALFVTYQTRAPSEVELGIWMKSLLPGIPGKDLTITQLEQGEAKVFLDRTDPFMPKPGEFRSLCLGLDEMTMIESAEKAWEEVFEASKRYGSHQTVCFKDPVIPEIIKHVFGGWVRFCDNLIVSGDKPNIQFYRKDFISSYKLPSKRNIQGVELLIGRYGRNQKIEFIGDFTKDEKTFIIKNNDIPKKIMLELANRNQICDSESSNFISF